MKSRTYSFLLVSLQILSMAYLGFILIQPRYLIIAIIPVILAALIGLWGVWEMQKFKFNVMPEVVEGATLVTTGPYKFIRNPMYTGLLIVGIAALVDHPRADVFIAYIILTTVLILKINREEYFLKKHFKEYEAYKTKTKKLIPFIY